MRGSHAKTGTGGPARTAQSRHPEPAKAVAALMWERCGIVRDGEGLKSACAEFERAGARVPLLVARCALAREESRGAHFRTDFPSKRSEFERHSVIRKDAGVTFA